MGQHPPKTRSKPLCPPTSAGRSRNMAAIRSRGNNTTEMAVIRRLREHGLVGWRRHYPAIGKPDFVWRSARVVLFVDGCFWHGCPRCYRAPRNNVRYWREKIRRNQTRDGVVVSALHQRGWKTLRVWECEVRRNGWLNRLRRRLGLSASLHEP